jgi:peptidoglycan-N-acetylglucosamine deacetylase
MKYILFVAGMMLFPALIKAQTNKPFWNDHTCAVVLTYDDGLNVQLDLVIPQLDSAGIKGTFYVNGSASTIPARIDDWRAIAESGHELGNHTLFHPCSATGRSWVNPNYDFNQYTLQRALDEIRMANALLYAIDHKKERTFAYTCGDMVAGTDSFNTLIHKDFLAARGVSSRFEDLHTVNLFDIGSFMMSENTGEQMIEMVKHAVKNEKLLVFLFHGVGGEHSINVSLEAHRKLIQYLTQHSAEIWTPTFAEAAKFISQNKQ